ncbi:unnamed protein product [Mytilus edulis]|uniref:Uncharacterized protein n=1 Tax=Mytilus edulis TaxID=6550 RepID=A0A8S3TV03_MYTED|nr:unnamed protein product [Mytilus edulis]
MPIATGATVTLISKKLFDSMHSPVLSTMDKDILTNSGSRLNVFGKTIIDIDINEYVYSNITVVADLNIVGILGIYFQRSHSCVIDITKGNIWVNGRECRLHFEGQIGCYGVSVASHVQLPLRMEVLVYRIRTTREPVPPIKEVDRILVANQEKSRLTC